MFMSMEKIEVSDRENASKPQHRQAAQAGNNSNQPSFLTRPFFHAQSNAIIFGPQNKTSLANFQE
jgi:hypothetical protein